MEDDGREVERGSVGGGGREWARGGEPGWGSSLAGNSMMGDDAGNLYGWHDEVLGAMEVYSSEDGEWTCGGAGVYAATARIT